MDLLRILNSSEKLDFWHMSEHINVFQVKLKLVEHSL